jgi:hypothetical protein
VFSVFLTVRPLLSRMSIGAVTHVVLKGQGRTLPKVLAEIKTTERRLTGR